MPRILEVEWIARSLRTHTGELVRGPAETVETVGSGRLVRRRGGNKPLQRLVEVKLVTDRTLLVVISLPVGVGVMRRERRVVVVVCRTRARRTVKDLRRNVARFVQDEVGRVYELRRV